MTAEFHTQFKPYAPKKGEQYMNSKQLEHFRKMLSTLKEELSQDIDRTVHTMQDEATIFADPNDRASQESFPASDPPAWWAGSGSSAS